MLAGIAASVVKRVAKGSSRPRSAIPHVWDIVGAAILDILPRVETRRRYDIAPKRHSVGLVWWAVELCREVSHAP